MANLAVVNATGSTVYLKATGAGSNGDPHIPEQAVTGPLTDTELRASPVAVSLSSAPLPTGAATAARQDTLLAAVDGIEAALAGSLTVGLPSGASTAAKQDTGNTSLATLAGAVAGAEMQVDVLTLPALPAGTNAIGKLAANSGVDIGDVDVTSLPDVEIAEKTITTQATTEADSGDNTLVAGPGSGQRIVVSSIVVQNESATATTILLKSGANTKRRALLQNQGDGVAWSFPPGREWKLGDNEALIVNLSGANSHGVTVDYYTEAV